MKICILGFGKMGKEIKSIAEERNHTITLVIDKDNTDDFNASNLKDCDVAIDFSTPESAYANILTCFENNVPIVSGTTGWLDKFDEVTEACNQNKQSFFYASNFSLGVNLFFSLNKWLGMVMNRFNKFDVDIEETHHTQKKDAPSGTAITLANDLIKSIDRKYRWKLSDVAEDNEIAIKAYREGDVFGIHKVNYESEEDVLEIKHTAKSRRGFALGAVLAAEYIKNKRGIFSMNDLLELY